MVPSAFETFFATLVGAGAALIGLLFVAISIAPEQTVHPDAPVERQATATSCFFALANPFLISSIALIPFVGVHVVAVTSLAMSAAALLHTITVGRYLLRHLSDWHNALRRAIFLLVSLTLYSGEFYVGTLLLNSPDVSAHLSLLTGVLVGINFLGLSRAWDLLGAHRYSFLELLKPMDDAEEASAKDTAARKNP